MVFWKYRRTQTAQTVPGAVAGPPDGRDAYAVGLEDGRREERRRRRGHPVITAVVALVAIAGAAALALAAHEGSFARGGQVVDDHIAAAAGQARAASQTAAAQTGQALQSAGATIQEKVSGSPPAVASTNSSAAR